ncbi:MAG TPA: hypothetical protein VK364_05025 [Hymenobacter sp.]|nr:hypothetical protein [Hymenobacter sp.]
MLRAATLAVLLTALASSTALSQNRAPATPTQRKAGAVKVPPPNTPMPAPATASGTTTTSNGPGLSQAKAIAPGLTGDPARQATVDDNQPLRQPVPAPRLVKPAATTPAPTSGKDQ